jgi:hypothetical protein
VARSNILGEGVVKFRGRHQEYEIWWEAGAGPCSRTAKSIFVHVDSKDNQDAAEPDLHGSEHIDAGRFVSMPNAEAMAGRPLFTFSKPTPVIS